MAKTSRFSLFQKCVIALTGITLINVTIAAIWGKWVLSGAPGIFAALIAVVLLPFAILPPLIRRLSWRVRNRLFITYFLVGILPIVLIYLFVQLGFFLVLGQTTNHLLHAELDLRLERLLSRAESGAETLADGSEWTLADLGEASSAIVRTADGQSFALGESEIPEIPSWSAPGLTEIVRDDARSYFLTAHAEAESNSRHWEVFAVERIDSRFLAELLPDIAAVSVMEGDTVQFRVNAESDADNARIVANSEEVAPSPAARGFWDSQIESGSPFTFRHLDDGSQEAGAIIAITRPSAILTRIFSTLGETAVILEIFMAVVAGIFITVEVVAIIASVKLARTLTRTVHDLHEGTRKVEEGDFSHRIPVRSRDQLSELASSFNGMTQKVLQLIDEVKEKEKLESELEIARQVQTLLFPKEIPKLTTLELAGVCNPARTVSGDYYDFILSESGVALVIGDISGKGISAALLMASLQASLHAQLGIGAEEMRSTAALVSRLNGQMYANTAPEKYATFFCALYNGNTASLSYTNAGHVAPILIRKDKVLRLESNGTVVGIFPTFPFEQQDIEMQSGDLLCAFTDGITEAEGPGEEQFGEQRLIELLQSCMSESLPDIIQIVMNAVHQWAVDPSARDDITMILARRL